MKAEPVSRWLVVAVVLLLFAGCGGKQPTAGEYAQEIAGQAASARSSLTVALEHCPLQPGATPAVTCPMEWQAAALDAASIATRLAATQAKFGEPDPQTAELVTSTQSVAATLGERVRAHDACTSGCSKANADLASSATTWGGLLEQWKGHGA